MPVRHSGFPSPASDYVQEGIDLNDLLISNRLATFFIQLHGEGLEYLASRALCIVDRSATPNENDFVIAVHEQNWLVKKFSINKITRKQELLPLQSPKSGVGKPISIGEDVVLWGVITKLIIDPKCIQL